MRQLLLTIALVASLQSFGWGKMGHDVTCAIAQKHLSASARERINDLLDGKSIIYWANWLDDASNSPEYAYSKTWHYKNIDADETYDNARLNPKGDITTALRQQIALLTDRSTKREEAILALKMVIHLMGDLHQPMHMGHLSDLGGNKWKVTYFRSDTNLHSVWDTALPESAHKWSHTEWAEELDRLSDADAKEVASGSIDDWARQTMTIATSIYDTTPEDSKLSYTYVSTWAPVVEQQFLRGGLRLAKVLNEAFK